MNRFMYIFLLSVALYVPSLLLGAGTSLSALLEQRGQQQVQSKASASSARKGRNTQQTKKARTVAKVPPVLTDRQQQITKALDNVRLQVDQIPLQNFLPWSEFMDLSRQEAMSLAKRLKRVKVTDYVLEKLDETYPLHWEYERPNYGKETQNVSFIYLTDASSHGTKTIVNEVKQVLQSVRRANPNARILLASEFSVMKDFTAPIRFAGKTNSNMGSSHGPYEQLDVYADKLNIDVLALEDFILRRIGEGVGYKMGKYIIYMSESDHPDFVNSLSKLTNEDIARLDSFVSQSSLGMRFRNEQWADYINAIKSFYDIVIVYCGNGHTRSDGGTAMDVQRLVGNKYIEIDFYTDERNAEEDDWEFAMDTLLCNEQVCVRLGVDDVAQDRIPEWDGERILYAKIIPAEIEAYVRTLPESDQIIIERAFADQGKMGIGDRLMVSYFSVALPSKSPQTK